MPSFSSTLQSIATGRAFRLPRLSARRSQVEKKVAQLSIFQGYEKASVLEHADLEEISTRVSLAIKQNQHAALKLKDLRLFALTIWDPSIFNAKETSLIQSYIEILNEKKIESAIRALAREYLNYWPEGETAWIMTQQFLRTFKPKRKSGFLWKSQSSGIFDGREAVESLAQECLISDLEVGQVFEGNGVQSDLHGGQFAQAVFRRLCKLCTKTLEWNAFVSVMQMARTSDEEESFPNARPELAHALLSPWRQKSPSDDMKQEIQHFLIGLLGDPRFGRSKWGGVDQKDIDVLRRWLAGEALEQFLRIVDETAEVNMWQYRRAFWQAYFDNELITDAWVAFGRDAQAIVRQRSKEDSTKEFKSYGELEGASSDQSVLLMKMGDHTISEWSHNGKVWIWKSGERGAPELYKTQYYKDNCRMANFGESHTGAPQGAWQHRVAEKIFKMTGVRVASNEYMPKRKRR